MAKQEGHSGSNNPGKAYKAAAAAARHPNPDAHVEFIVSNLPTALPAGQSLLLQAGGTLSSDDVRLLSQSLSPESSPCYGSLQPVPALSEAASRFLSGKREDFKAQQTSVCRMVDTALKKYALLTTVGRLVLSFRLSSWRCELLLIYCPCYAQEPGYELHVICGVNANVVRIGVRKYQYSHINFLASPRRWRSANAVPMLFFAECRYGDEGVNDEMSCWPVVVLSSGDAGKP